MTDSPDLAIAGDVLVNIAQLAIEQVEGVRPTQPAASVSELLGGRRARGIVIDRDGDDVWVDLILAVAYGVEIPKAAKAAQQAVREGISSMTGLAVRSVNVSVESVELPDDEAASGATGEGVERGSALERGFASERGSATERGSALERGDAERGSAAEREPAAKRGPAPRG